MRRFPFHQVDVFTERPFAGNPLAVFPDAEGLSDAEMQKIAREMNLSETTFVTPPQQDGDARVRIFTPGTELPFAGHPSIGTACTLLRLGRVPCLEPETRVVLELNVGPTPLDVWVTDGAPRGALLHQGAPTFGEDVPAEEAAAVLGLQVSDLHDELTPRVVSTGLPFAIIPLRSTRALAGAWFRLDLLAEFERRHASVYPFAFTGDDEPFVAARQFSPLEGIIEDPATGSAAGPLAAYLARSGLLAAGAARVIAQGDHAGRPSRLTVSVTEERGRIVDVQVAGGVVPILSGVLELQDA
jgi:trans-2,3-dihydro-3-hydroxyanthranilate isomerase